MINAQIPEETIDRPSGSPWVDVTGYPVIHPARPPDPYWATRVYEAFGRDMTKVSAFLRERLQQVP